MHPIVHQDIPDQGRTAELYNASGLALTHAANEDPAGSGVYVVTAAELVTAELAAGTYAVRIVDANDVLKGAGAHPLEWNGSAELPQRSDLRAWLGSQPQALAGASSGLVPSVVRMMDANDAATEGLEDLGIYYAANGRANANTTHIAGSAIQQTDGKAHVLDGDGTAISKASALASLAARFSGITSLAHWLRALARSDAPDLTAMGEINDGVGAYDPSADSHEAIRDRVNTRASQSSVDAIQAEALAVACTIAEVLDETGKVLRLDGATLSDEDDVYARRLLVITGGDAQHVQRRVLSYIGSTKTITLSGPLAVVPAVDDTALLAGHVE